VDLKSGYKRTAAGVIPEDWQVEPLGGIGRWFSGGTPSKADATYWNGDIPWISAKDMKMPRLHDAIDHISRKAVSEGARLLPAGAILMVVRGMILAHSFPAARAECQVAFNQDIKAVVTRGDVDGNFVLQWLLSNRKRILSITTESTHGTKRLPTEMLFRQEFSCPPRPEQEAIAEALNDADALIESLEQLIAKKRHLKEAAMQELLTGKKRLPGFTGEWAVRALGARRTGSVERRDDPVDARSRLLGWRCCPMDFFR